jgi:hypothetical protein
MQNDPKYGEGVDQRDVPWYSKGELQKVGGPKDPEGPDAINEGAFKIMDENAKGGK